MSESGKSFVVHLERSRTARAFDLDGRESLWEDELNKIYRILARHVEALDKSSDNGRDSSKSSWKDDKRPLLSIAVFGTHGSGKSSLLKTLVEEVNEERFAKDREREKKILEGKLYSLPVIEPNMLAEDEHFLYTFLATALEEDLNCQRKREHTSVVSRTLTPVQQAFQEVSEYLQVIDKVERPGEHDPLGFSLERLERHTSGLLLRRGLSTFHDRLASSLAGSDSTSLVLLPVDDPDMSLDRLVSTLDTYRRYLQHPRLVPIFTFTGRLAEELLRVHFARNLLLEESRKLFQNKTFVDPSTPLEMPEQLAVQYLVKLFPIRNRIRLGPAPARVQAARYIAYSGNGTASLRGSTRGWVWNVLEAASNLLFGYPEWPIAPRIRLALRPATLRRQLQVLDAMHDSWIDEVLALQGDEASDGKSVSSEHRWIQIFDRAAWALINAHRDVIREFRMQIEELHSLTPQNLSQEILSAVLSQDLDTRRELLQRWRLQVEDRRAQILSLLALNAFRPQMEKEELTGDDPDALKPEPEGTSQSKSEEGDDGDGFTADERRSSFSSMKGGLWFLKLWVGFYLPQILARSRLDSSKEKPESRSVLSVGWNLQGGPRHAIREVLVNEDISATGMMLLNPKSVSQKLLQEEHRISLAIHLWCFVGYTAGRPWAAVSFWRGLSLIGQLFEDFQRAILPNQVDYKTYRKGRIRFILRKHCHAMMEPGSFQDGGEGGAIFFKTKTSETPSGDELGQLTDAIYSWLEYHREARNSPIRKKPNSEQLKENPQWWKEAFDSSFIRLLHGEYLLGQFWPELGSVYLGGPPSERKKPGPWHAWGALKKWSEVMSSYFDKVKVVDPVGSESGGRCFAEIFTSCPLLYPFFQEINDVPAGRPLEEDVSGDGEVPGAIPKQTVLRKNLEKDNSRFWVELPSFQKALSALQQVEFQDSPYYKESRQKPKDFTEEG